MPGTDPPLIEICYALRGTDIAYSAMSDYVLVGYAMPVMSAMRCTVLTFLYVDVCYTMRGSDLACAVMSAVRCAGTPSRL
eukprot:904571-Rhodomonas_salina.1